MDAERRVFNGKFSTRYLFRKCRCRHFHWPRPPLLLEEIGAEIRSGGGYLLCTGTQVLQLLLLCYALRVYRTTAVVTHQPPKKSLVLTYLPLVLYEYTTLTSYQVYALSAALWPYTAAVVLQSCLGNKLPLYSIICVVCPQNVYQ